MTVDVGAYPNLQSEQQASLQRLSFELHQHPEMNAVEITAGRSAWRHGVMGFIRIYPGNNNLFWYDNRFSTPNFGIVKGKIQGISAYSLVSEEPIHVTARHTGKSEDVSDYNAHLRVQSGLGKY